MTDILRTVPIPKTQQELEQAIRQYKVNDLSGDDLFCQWQAIREASLKQHHPEADPNPVAGDDSY